MILDLNKLITKGCGIFPLYDLVKRSYFETDDVLSSLQSETKIHTEKNGVLSIEQYKKYDQEIKKHLLECHLCDLVEEELIYHRMIELWGRNYPKENCNKMQAGDIYTYLTLINALKNSHDSEAEIRMKFLKLLGVGNDLKQINFYFNSHFITCGECDYIYRELKIISDSETSVYDKMEDPANIQEAGLGQNEINTINTYKLKKRSFGLNHPILTTRHSEDLRYYIREKVESPNTETNPNFEKHIESCQDCQEYLILSSQVNQIRKKVAKYLSKK